MWCPAPTDTPTIQFLNTDEEGAGRLRETAGQGVCCEILSPTCVRELYPWSLIKWPRKAWAMTPIDMLNGRGKPPGVSALGKGLKATKECWNHREKIIFPKDEPPNWLYNTEWSTLKSYTCKNHNTDWEGCIYIFRKYIYVNTHIYNYISSISIYHQLKK